MQKTTGFSFFENLVNKQFGENCFKIQPNPGTFGLSVSYQGSLVGQQGLQTKVSIKVK